MSENVNGFDWSDKEAVVVPQQDAIAVYANPDGELVIRRRRDWDEDEDKVIVVSALNISSLIEAMQRVYREIQE